MPAIYSAHWVLPIISPPIVDGAVAIERSQIIAVGPQAELTRRFPEAQVFAFGAAAILPGFVNAHTHFELTVMRGFLEDVEHDFFAWLRKLTLARMALTEEDLRVSATCGAIEAARAGITCVADSSSVAGETIRALRDVGLRGIVYQESFGPDPKRATENVAKLRNQVSAARTLENDLVRAGVSPHAPYTVSAPQLEMISRMAIDEGLPLMMHAAESDAEEEFMLDGSGPFAEGLRKRGIEWHAPRTSSIQHLVQCGVLETKPLLAHCINVGDADLELVKKSNAAIAHCPKSNAKLSHGTAPFARFVSNGIDVGLGSDSVASNNTCDILEEARFATLLARLGLGEMPFRGGLPPANFSVSAADALFAATLGGARALRLDDQIGALSEGRQADITIVGLDGTHQLPVHDPANSLIFSSGGRDVVLTMVAGKEVYRACSAAGVNNDVPIARLREIRLKLESAIVS